MIKTDELIEKQILKNKTFRFLIPVLVTYGEEFYKYMNNLDRRAFGVGSNSVMYEDEEPLLYVLFHTDFKKKLFKEFLKFIKEKVFFKDDYVFGNICNTNYHMVVLKFPTNFTTCYSLFKEGRYSKMFNNEEIDTYFRNEIDKKILIKSKGIEFLLLKEIKEKFDVDISLEEILLNRDYWEFSVSPLKREEFFE